MAKKVYLLIEDRNYWIHEPLVFSTEAKLLNYFKSIYPDKKRLRLKAWDYHPTLFTLLNHTTPVDAGRVRIVHAEIDKEAKRGF